MTPEQKRLLVDHLDESRTGKPAAGLEQLLAEDGEAAQEWQYLNLAVDAIREAGLHAQVSAIRESMKAEQAQTAPSTEPQETVDQYIAPMNNRAAEPQQREGIVRSMNRYALRAAAVVIIISAGSAVYKYMSTSSGSLYDRYYSSYDLNTSRGAAATQPIEQAYDAKNWTAVISLAQAAKKPDNQTEFLAGMASLELNRCDDAITHFEQVIATNAQTGSDFYQDDAEFYLAISWLGCHKVNQAMPMLEKIKADPQHKYHEKVAKMSFFDLRLAQYKENK
jgi:hypothetical protein